MLNIKSKRVFSTFIAVNALLSIHVGLAFGRSTDFRDDCRRLPPPSPTTKIENNQSTSAPLNGNTTADKTIYENNIELILNNGMNQLPFDTHNKTAIFILGNTGSGKTTLSLTINGDLSKIHAVKTHSGNLVIVDDDEKIGAPSTSSKTLVPEYIVNPNNSVAFYDCPGFDDNRGPELDLAAMYFVKAITEHVTRAKFLFTATYSSMIIGNDRNSFDLLIKHAAKFLQNMEKMTDAVGLIVTKVDNYDSMGYYQDDDLILEQTVGFLELHLVTLQRRLSLSDTTFMDTEKSIVLRNKVKFIESLLHQDETGHYTKIWFLRNPPGCGPFSTIPYAYEARNKIINMYSRSLTYANVSHDDFGWTLKDTTLLKLTDTIVPSIEVALLQFTNKTLQTLADDYQTQFQTAFNKSGSSEQVEAILGLQTIYNNLTDEAGSWNDNLKIAEKIAKIASTVGGVQPSDILLNLTQRREEWLKFFYVLMGSQNVEDSSKSNSNDDQVTSNISLNSTLNVDTNSSGAPEEIRKSNLSSTSTRVSFIQLLQPFHNLYSQFRVLHDGVKETVLKESLPDTRAQIENVTSDILDSIHNQYALKFTEELKRDEMAAFQKFKRDYESILAWQTEETFLSAQVDTLKMHLFHPSPNFTKNDDSSYVKLQSMEANFLQLLQFAQVTEQADSFHPSFTSPFIENILKPFRSLMKQILANVKEKIVTDLFPQIEAQAKNILTNYMKTYGQEIRLILASAENKERRTAIEMLEKSFHKITQLLQISNMNIISDNGYISTQAISNTIITIFNGGKVTHPEIVSLTIPESKLKGLSEIFGLDKSAEVSSILKNVVLGYSNDIRALRDEVHFSIRDEYIPELINQTLSTATDVLTALQTKYFKIVEDTLKLTSEKDDTVAAAVDVHRSYKNLQNLGPSLSVNQTEPISSSAYAISKIFSAIGVAWDFSTFVDEMNRKADLFSFYQNVTKSTKATGEAAATSLDRVINNFLLEFNELHNQILVEVREKLIPETRLGIQQFYHAFLEGIRENYFASYNILIGDESTNIDAVKSLYVHCHKLDTIKENFANGTPTVLVLVENLGIENEGNTNWDIFWLYFLSSAFGNPLINPTDIQNLTTLEVQLKVMANITNDISDLTLSKEEKADEFREFFRQFKRTCEDEKMEIKTKLIPQKLQNFQSAMSGILRKVTGAFLEPLTREMGSSGDKRKVFEMFKSYYVGLGKFLESDKDSELMLSMRMENLIRTVFPDETKDFTLDAEIEHIKKLETEILIFLVATGSEKGQLATEYMKMLQTSFDVEVNQPLKTKKSEIDNLARDVLVPDLIKQIRQGAVKNVNSFLDIYKAEFNQKMKARGPALREAYTLLEVDSHIAQQIVDQTQNFINNNPTSTIRSAAVALKEIVYPNFKFSKKFSEGNQKFLEDVESYLDKIREVVPSDRATEKVHILKDAVSHLQNQLDSYRDEIRMALKEKKMFMELFCTETNNKWNCNYSSTLGTIDAEYLKWA